MKYESIIKGLLNIIISIFIGIALVLFDITNKNYAIIYAFLSSISIFLFSIYIDFKFCPKPLNDLRKLIYKTFIYSNKHFHLKLIFDNIIENLKKQFNSLSRGYYTIELSEIPNISIETILKINKFAFATFIDNPNNNFYTNKSGLKYLNAWYDKAKSGKNVELIRLFILQDINTCSKETLKIIEDHIENNIIVKIIDKKKALKILKNNNLDFGLFDNNCLMIVNEKKEINKATLSIYIQNDSFDNENIFDKYIKIKNKLIENSLNYQEYIQKFTKPINETFWNKWLANNNNFLAPPHGISNKDAELIFNYAVNELDNKNELSVAILGLTPELINICINSKNVKEIVLIDQSQIEIHLDSKLKIYREYANWITFKTNKKFDIILGDESLNNLNKYQYYLFFKNMNFLLKKSGVLCMRIMGRFSKIRNFTKNDLLNQIKKSNINNKGLCIDKAIKFLHSNKLGFKENEMLINNKYYNKNIENLIKKDASIEKQAEQWFFPTKNTDSLYLTSPTIEYIQLSSKDFFNIMPLYNYNCNDCESSITNFYKIICFKKNNKMQSKIRRKKTYFKKKIYHK